MQDRYTGDIGDFAKYGLLRHLCQGKRLGVAWYLYPNEDHNEDGRFTEYLDDPDQWRDLDPELFDCLKNIVHSGRRNVKEIEGFSILRNCRFSHELLNFAGAPESRRQQRGCWFQQATSDLQGADIVFADPDNGLFEDERHNPGSAKHWKSVPLSEALTLSSGRTGVIYHHNTRRPGGHRLEIQYWLSKLGKDAIAIYWRRVSNRTFFIVNPTRDIEARAEEFAEKWGEHCELIKCA
jgi:hypothetical protein